MNSYFPNFLTIPITWRPVYVLKKKKVDELKPFPLWLTCDVFFINWTFKSTNIQTKLSAKDLNLVFCRNYYFCNVDLRFKYHSHAKIHIHVIQFDTSHRANGLFKQSLNGTGNGTRTRNIGLLYIMLNLHTGTYVGTYETILHLTWWTYGGTYNTTSMHSSRMRT